MQKWIEKNRKTAKKMPILVLTGVKTRSLGILQRILGTGMGAALPGLALALALVLIAGPTAAAVAGSAADPVTMDPAAIDPVTTDPVTIDPDFPPAMRELSFTSHGQTLSGLIYLADGAGPHPAVILLHGFPGNEKNLDIAQALRRAGWNVLFFHYTGAWGSQGSFSLRNAMADVLVAVDYLKANAARLRTDPAHIAFVGHSMGGFMALWGGSQFADITCTVALSAADFGAAGMALRQAQKEAGEPPRRPDDAGPGEDLDQGQALVMLADYDLPDLFTEMRADAEALSVSAFAAGHGGKNLLLIGGKRDKVVPPVVHRSLMAMFGAVPGLALEEKLLDTDHAFSWKRIELARTITDWLNRNCRPGP